MKQPILILLLYFLVHLSCAQKSMEYHIIKTDYTKGTYKIFSYELQNDSLGITKYSTNNRPPKVLFKTILNSIQKSKLINILNGFDLPNMQKEYVDNKVEGEVHSVYDIKINKHFKSIYLYFVEVSELKKLDDFVFELLPANQYGWHDNY
jgi:hypothetical protein